MSDDHREITFIAVNPGSLLTTKMVMEGYGKCWSPTDKGADILGDLANSDDHSTISGKYFDNDKGVYGQAHQNAYDQVKIRQLRELTCELLFSYK